MMMQESTHHAPQGNDRKWRCLLELIDELIDLLAKEALYLVQGDTPSADLVERKEAVELAYTFLCRNLFATPLSEEDRETIVALGLEQRVRRVITLARENQISLAHHRQALSRIIDDILQETFADEDRDDSHMPDMSMAGQGLPWVDQRGALREQI